MKILHTSDWHLGAPFGPKKRYREFRETLRWLLAAIREHRIQTVLIAGDVFDSGAPSNAATELYYDFLYDAVDAGVRDVIVTAGNHDSPGFLDAPQTLLRRLRVHIVGRARENPDDEIIPLGDSDVPEAVVCAVPYLRDRDVRSAVSGEDAAVQNRARRDGIIRHYRTICTRARERYPNAPLIATGHFFATGGRVSGTVEIGFETNLALDELPETVDYWALGHLHIPQSVGGRNNARYCGSLLRMSFGDTGTPREVTVLDTDAPGFGIQRLAIPAFQKIETVAGNPDELRARLEELKNAGEPVWIRAENTGSFEARLQHRLNDLCAGSPAEVLQCSNRAANPDLPRRRSGENRKLSDLTPEEVFVRLLDRREIQEPERTDLLEKFRTAVRETAENDRENA